MSWIKIEFGKGKVHELPKTQIEQIDCDKLAKAIVKAQEISTNEANKSNKYTSGTFATLIILAFRGLSIAGWITILAIAISVWNAREMFQWNDFPNIFASVCTLLLMLGFTSVLGLYSILLWKASKEVESERDRNYIIALFSGVVSFAALIVALVALVKG